jgi:hypothetical protein
MLTPLLFGMFAAASFLAALSAFNLTFNAVFADAIATFTAPLFALTTYALFALTSFASLEDYPGRLKPAFATPALVGFGGAGASVPPRSAGVQYRAVRNLGRCRADGAPSATSCVNLLPTQPLKVLEPLARGRRSKKRVINRDRDQPPVLDVTTTPPSRKRVIQRVA